MAALQVQSLEDAAAACLALHRQGPPVVVVTSLELSASAADGSPVVGAEVAGVGGAGTVVMLASCATRRWAAHRRSGTAAAAPSTARCDDEEEVCLWAVTVPKLAGAYTGTGDLTAALLLAFLAAPDGAEADVSAAAAASADAADADAAAAAVPAALQSVAAALAAVLQRTLAEAGPGAELRLVQSKRELEAPNPAAMGIGKPVALASSLVARARLRLRQQAQQQEAAE
jgi:pyridoxal/pyridoxine/pyridoxamine kinase